MLLTLAARTFQSQIAGSSDGPVGSLAELPAFTKKTLELHGLYLTTDMLTGADATALDKLREAADRAGCPCLVLIESDLLPFTTDDDDKGDAAMERMVRVLAAAARLGCNAAALRVPDLTDDDQMDIAAERFRYVISKANQRDINMLFMPTGAQIDDPDRLTDLIKRIGGFRIGTLPDFAVAATAKDPVHHLRRLVPYASALLASSHTFKSTRKAPGFTHPAYDLNEYLQTVAALGYSGTVAIDYQGEDDPELGVKQTRELLEAVLEAQ